MIRTRFTTHAPLRRRLAYALLLGIIAVCAVQSARADWKNGGGHHSWQLWISGVPAALDSAGQAYSFTPRTNDPNGRALSFAVANRPLWASFDSGTGQLSGTPSNANAGTYSNIVIAVSDGVNTATLPPFSVQVLASQASPPPAPPPLPAPTISGNPTTTDIAGSVYAFQPSASGPSGLTLSFSVQNKPTWAAFSIASGLLSGTPSSAQAGSYGNIIISVSDGQASSALPAFAITVTAPPDATGSAVVTLVPPTQNTDGSALTDLAGMRVYYGTSSSTLSQVVEFPGATAPMSYTVSNLASGTWYFGATAYSTTGAESSISAVAGKGIP
jgi:Putative Ig domain